MACLVFWRDGIIIGQNETITLYNMSRTPLHSISNTVPGPPDNIIVAMEISEDVLMVRHKAHIDVYYISPLGFEKIHRRASDDEPSILASLSMDDLATIGEGGKEIYIIDEVMSTVIYTLAFGIEAGSMNWIIDGCKISLTSTNIKEARYIQRKMTSSIRTASDVTISRFIVFNSESARVMHIAYHEGFLYALLANGYLYRWDVKTWKQQSVFAQISGRGSLHLLDIETICVIGSGVHFTHIDIATFTITKTYQKHHLMAETDTVSYSFMDSDLRHAYVCYKNMMVRHTLDERQEWVTEFYAPDTRLAFSPCRRYKISYSPLLKIEPVSPTSFIVIQGRLMIDDVSKLTTLYSDGSLETKDDSPFYYINLDTSINHVGNTTTIALPLGPSENRIIIAPPDSFALWFECMQAVRHQFTLYKRERDTTSEKILLRYRFDIMQLGLMRNMWQSESGRRIPKNVVDEIGRLLLINTHV